LLANPVFALFADVYDSKFLSFSGNRTVSFRVECPLAWLVRADLKQFTPKERAKDFFDGQSNDQARFGSLAKPITSLTSNFRWSSTHCFKFRLEEIKSYFLAHFLILRRRIDGGLNS